MDSRGTKNVGEQVANFSEFSGKQLYGEFYLYD